MENSDVKKENRKALPKFFLVVLASGIFGGVAGFLSGVAGASSLPEAVTAGMRHLLAAIVPWGIPVGSLVLLGGGWVLYRKARSLARDWAGGDEAAADKADVLLDWVLLLSSLTLILDFFFLAAADMGGAETLEAPARCHRFHFLLRGGDAAAAEDSGSHKDAESREAGQRVRYEVSEEVV